MTRINSLAPAVALLVAVAATALAAHAAFAQASPSPGTVTSPALGASLVLIQSGTFVMGSDKDSESPRHLVTISRPYYLQTTEVTQAQWRKVMGTNPAFFKNCDECPVENIGYLAIKDFISKLNSVEKTTAYRLPTEAEWEYAAHAETTTLYPWGDAADCAKANFGHSTQSSERECRAVNPGRPVKVGTFAPNGWGLYDMYGNVWEQVDDCYLSETPTFNDVIDPVGPTCTFSRTFGIGEQAVVRGNSWSGGSRANPITKRVRSGAPSEYGNIGFRLARSITGSRPDSTLVHKVLDGREVPPKPSYLMYRFIPGLNVYDASAVRTPELTPGSFAATFLYPNGTQVHAHSRWTVPPTVLRPGTTLTLNVDTDHAMAISLLDQTVRVQPGTGQMVSLQIPPIDASTFLRWHNRLRLGVSVYNDRYISALAEYYYESDARENGVVLPIKLGPAMRAP